MSYHKLLIIGNLGRDPEMRYLPSGQAATNMNIAANRVYTNNQGERITETAWYRVSAWGKLAENCNQYLKKGSKVFVEGRLKPDPETGGPTIFYRQDGSAGASFEVVAQVVTFLDSAQHGPQRFVGQDEFDYNEDLSAPGSIGAIDDQDDMPF